MKLLHNFYRIIGLTCLAAIVAGCATSQPQEARRFFWPPLPERPRIEWIKAYNSQLDFPKSGFQQFIATIAGEEEPVLFNKPLKIKSDGNGKVYVTDPGASSVFIYDLTNRKISFLGGDAIEQFKQPVGLALDDAGNVYVSDAEKGVILVFDKNDRPLRAISTKGVVQRNSDIDVDTKRKRLIVVDIRGHKVAFYTLDGVFISSFGERGEGDGKFNFPQAVAVNSKGEIIIGDTMNARVQIFDSDGKFLRKFGSRGDGPADFQILKSVAVDSDDNIYVTEGKGHKFIIFSTNGDYLLTIGGLYSALQTGKQAPGGFVIPQGIDIDKNDTIFVVDQLNRRFQVFQYISDKFLKANPIPGYQGS